MSGGLSERGGRLLREKRKGEVAEEAEDGVEGSRDESSKPTSLRFTFKLKLPTRVCVSVVMMTGVVMRCCWCGFAGVVLLVWCCWCGLVDVALTQRRCSSEP